MKRGIKKYTNAFKRLSNAFKRFPNAFERVCAFPYFSFPSGTSHIRETIGKTFIFSARPPLYPTALSNHYFLTVAPGKRKLLSLIHRKSSIKLPHPPPLSLKPQPLLREMDVSCYSYDFSYELAQRGFWMFHLFVFDIVIYFVCFFAPPGFSVATVLLGRPRLCLHVTQGDTCVQTVHHGLGPPESLQARGLCDVHGRYADGTLLQWVLPATEQAQPTWQPPLLKLPRAHQHQK